LLPDADISTPAAVAAARRQRLQPAPVKKIASSVFNYCQHDLAVYRLRMRAITSSWSLNVRPLLAVIADVVYSRCKLSVNCDRKQRPTIYDLIKHTTSTIPMPSCATFYSFFFFYYFLFCYEAYCVFIITVYYIYVAARRHICFCFMAKSAFWRGFSALAPYTGVGPI